MSELPSLALISGLVTRLQLDATPPALEVTWIAWDSPFRAADLQVGDRIVSIGGKPLQDFLGLAVGKGGSSILPGQYAESRGYAAAGLDLGSALELRVRRRAPGTGWTEVGVTALLMARPNYRNADNRELVAPDGPQSMSSDNFYTGGWGTWATDTMIPLLSRVLDRENHRGSFVSRYEERSLRETHGDRVAFAVKNYPGAWSTALQADYEAARSAAAGRLFPLGPKALDFRRRGEELAARVREQAQAAWTAFQDSHGADTISAFPAVSPVRGDITPVVGKIIVLPALTNRDWVSDANHGWFAAGGDGWYFLDAESPAAEAMLRAQRRYARLVDPNIAAQWEFVARITADPRLTVVGSQAQFGLIAEPLAALVGGTMFVDLTQRQDTQVAFAGEADLMDDTPDLPPDDASPAQVLAALVGAVKNGDIVLWRALHASWWIERRSPGDGQPERVMVHPVARPPDDAMFEESRRSILGRVLHAEPSWTDDPVTIARAGRFPGAEAIEEVEVWLDHVGLFDGETRTFTDVTVRPVWKLQRIGQGSWRVAEAQPI